MQAILTIPNAMPEVALKVTHTLPLPPLCPVTGNPQPGSEIAIHYQPDATLLDVFGLSDLLMEYAGHQQIRDIEYMLQHLTKRLGMVLHAQMVVTAQVILDLGQVMKIEVSFDGKA